MGRTPTGTHAIKRAAGSVRRVRRMQRRWDSITVYGRRVISIGCTSGIFSSWRTICELRFRRAIMYIKLFLPTSERCEVFRLDQLFEATANTVSRDDIYAMIACGDIHVDLSSAPMSEPSRVRVFTNEQAARLLVPPAAIDNGC